MLAAMVVIVPGILNSLFGDSNGRSVDDHSFQHSNGARAGTEDGINAGYGDRIDYAKDQAYWNIVTKAKAANDYMFFPHYCLVIIVTAFAAGYFGQYFLFYALRRIGILADIDAILLPKDSQIVKFRTTANNDNEL